MSLWEFRTALRGARYRGDAPQGVQLPDGCAWPDEVLQLVGDALLVGVASDSSSSYEFACRCVVRLQSHGCDGNAELAEALSARLGEGAQTLLRPALVDLEEWASVRPLARYRAERDHQPARGLRDLGNRSQKSDISLGTPHSGAQSA